MGSLKDLELLIQSRYPLIAIQSSEEDRVAALLQQASRRLDLPLFVWTVTDGMRRSGSSDVLCAVSPPLPILNELIANRDAGIYHFKDLHRHFNEPAVVRRLQDLAPVFVAGRGCVVLSGAELTLPPEIDRTAAHFELELPSEEELRALVRRVLKEVSGKRPVQFRLSGEEFDRFVDGLQGLTFFEAERLVTRAAIDDGALTTKDLEEILRAKKRILEREGILEYLSLQDVEEIGGLATLKAWLAKRRGAYTAEAERFGVEPPKGVLLLGVPGCGKSLTAKVVAREWGLPLLRMEPGRLYDKYIGESDKNLERALRVVERMAPCVLLVDEIEKGFAYVQSADADAGLSRRIFGRFLAWLQDRDAPVFIVATCNHFAHLPPELTRKGRFDEVFFIDLPNEEERQAIFVIHLRRRKRDPAAFDLAALARASQGFSGAEIEQAVVSCLYTAFSCGVELTTAGVLAELASTRPLSVTRREEMEALRSWAQGRAVDAG